MVNVQEYASRLAKMRSYKKGGAAAASQPKPAAVTTAAEETPGRGSKLQLLRKQLEESKARQEAELSSRQELESIVSGLQRELQERDAMIAGLRLTSEAGSLASSVLGSPFVMSPDSGSPGSSTPPGRITDLSI